MDASRTDTATFAGGCFWCVEAVFRMTEGVQEVQSGYTGGHVENPTYQLVCTGTTGHAEAVRITFDPDRISYRELLEIFFGTHDPTTRDRQGPDVGTQYRSAVYYHTPEQARLAREVIEEIEREGVFDAPVVTEVTEAGPFYPAEAYHDDYFSRNGQQPYCRTVIAPKVAKFRQRFAHRLRAAV